VQTTELPSQTALAKSSAEDVKQQRKVKRAAFINNIRDSLDSVLHQFALSPTETAVAFNRSPTWAYRKIYDGTFRVISSGGRLMIPRAEIERFIARADKYDPQPKEGGVQNGNDKT
jgi:hypothetical protein